MTDTTESEKRCPLCDASMVTYTHTINKGSTVSMKKLYDMGGKAHLKDIGLTYNQRANFQKLAYWGAVYQTEEKGVWALSDTGTRFVEGIIALPSHMSSYRGEAREADPEKTRPVFFKEIYPYEIQDEEVTRYKQREDYIADAYEDWANT